MNRLRRNPFNVLFNEVNSVQEDLARLFHRFSPVAGHTVPGVLVNLWEDEQALYAEFDLPGMDPAKIEVTVTEGNQLSVQGERAAPEIQGAVWVRQERPIGQFVRAVTLPALVDADRVEAKYEHGVLRLTLPKSEAAKPRKIEVKTGG